MCNSGLQLFRALPVLEDVISSSQAVSISSGSLSSSGLAIEGNESSLTYGGSTSLVKSIISDER